MSKVREGYKMTELGEIPNEWEVKKLGELVKFEGGSQPPKKYFSNECLDGMIRLIQIRDYKNDNFKIYVPKELCRRFCDDSDVMIGRYGPPIFQILRGLEGAYNVALIKAIPDEEKLNKEYLFYFLKNEKLFNLIESLSQRTSGQTGIDMEVLKDYLVESPSLYQQKKIVSILSTVDEQIDNTEKLIQKNQELKKGLMQKLLTKGIGHTEYKKTELGEIPKAWEVKKLDEVCNIVDYRGKTPEKVDKGILLVTAKNINKGYIDYEVSKEYVKEEDYNEVMSRGLPAMGDVLFTTEAPLGNVANVDNDFIALAQRVIKFSGEVNLVDNYYLKYYMLGEVFQKNLEKQATGSTVLGIKGSRLKKLEIVIPSIKEQKEIASILESVDKKIEQYQKKKQKLEEAKKGLMQQLLTGKIRVV